MKRKIRLSDVKASFDYERGKQMPACAVWFGRPIADLITPFFFNLGIQANDVTLIRALITVAALLFLASGVQFLFYLAGILGLFAFVLDFVDGHLARLNDNATYWGKYSDGLVDYLFPTVGLFAVGVGITINGGGLWYIAIGASVSLIALMTRTSRDRLRYFQCWMASQCTPGTEDISGEVLALRRQEYIISVAAANGRTAAFALLFVPDGGQMFFFTLLIIQGLTEPIWLAISLYIGYHSLNKWRKSIHSAR